MPRPKTRSQVENRRAIDVLLFYRLGHLRAPSQFSLHWSQSGKPYGSIAVRTEDGAVTLGWQSRALGGEWQGVEQRVPLDWLPCKPFGGRRPLFRCPQCEGRAVRLYLALREFSCRRCARLNYLSQQEPPRGRGELRMRRINLRLGGSGSRAEGLPAKPKWMRWRTYYRWCDEYDKAAQRSFAGMALTLGGLTARMGKAQARRRGESPID
jgi:hypothetical protein